MGCFVLIWHNFPVNALNKYGRLGHVILLYFITFFTYLTVGYFVHKYYVGDASFLLNDSHRTDYYFYFVQFYLWALVLYLLQAFGYYKVCFSMNYESHAVLVIYLLTLFFQYLHSWSRLIKVNHTKPSDVTLLTRTNDGCHFLSYRERRED